MGQSTSTTHHASCETALGRVWLVRSEAGLLMVKIGGEEAELLAELARRRPGPSTASPDELAADIAAIAGWLAGGSAPLDMAVDLEGLPAYTRQILETLRRVPVGQTCSYGELAALAGRPGTARAVGQVMNRNPIPIVIPCHRVVASNGIGGFGCGLDAKRMLLGLEGVTRYGAAVSTRVTSAPAC